MRRLATGPLHYWRRAVIARILSWFFATVSVAPVHAADWYVLYAGDLPLYMSSVCRLRWLLLTHGVSKDNIITLGNSLKNYPTYDELVAPDAYCEPDVKPTSGITQSFLFSILTKTYDDEIGTPKVLNSAATDNLFIYLAGDTGYDTLRLDGHKAVLSGYDLFTTLMGGSVQFKNARVFVDGTHFADTFMAGAISGASAWNSNTGKSLRVVGSGVLDADATAADSCYCAPNTDVRDVVQRFRELHHLGEPHNPSDQHYCLSTKFGLAFSSLATGPAFSNHLAAVKSAVGSTKISEKEYGIFPEDGNGLHTQYCGVNATNTSTGPADCGSLYTALPYANAAVLAGMTAPSYAAACTKQASSETLGSFFFDRTMRRNDNDALRTELSQRTDYEALFASFISSHACTTASCADSTISLTTAAQNSCFKDLLGVTSTTLRGYDSFTLRKWTLPLANMCTTATLTGDATKQATTKSDMETLFRSTGAAAGSGEENNAELSFILAMVGFIVSGALYVGFMFFDTRTMEDTEEMQAIKDKEQSRAAGRMLLQEHDRGHGASPL